MPVEDFIIYVYCCVDEALHEVVKTPSENEDLPRNSVIARSSQWNWWVNLWEKTKTKASGDIFALIGMIGFQT